MTIVPGIQTRAGATYFTVEYHTGVHTPGEYEPKYSFNSFAMQNSEANLSHCERCDD